MQLSQYSDYSCRVLIYLAVCSKERISVRDISEAYGISLNHLVKVVHQLGKLGMIKTTRGRRGGIRLAKSPAEINIGEVIRQTEPNFSLVECFSSERGTCPISGNCGLQGILRKALNSFLAELDRFTLEDVVKHNAEGLSKILMRASN